MAISRVRKEELLAEYRQQYAQSTGVILADYKSLTTHQLDSLRQRAREQHGQVFVVKNTLLALVLTEAGVKSVEGVLVGSTLAVFCHKDIAAVAKLARDFTKEVEEGRFAIKGGVLEGHLLNAKQAQAVADMPSREVLLSQVLRTINAPASQMVGVVAGGIRQILNVIKAYADKLEGAGSAEAAA